MLLIYEEGSLAETAITNHLRSALYAQDGTRVDPVWQGLLATKELGQLTKHVSCVISGLQVERAGGAEYEELVEEVVGEVQDGVVGTMVVEVVVSGADEGRLHTQHSYTCTAVTDIHTYVNTCTPRPSHNSSHSPIHV